MREGQLAENIVYFARALRAAGIPVGPGAVLDALTAVEAAGVGTREDFYWTLHAVFVKRHEHTLLFDQAFHLFFRRKPAIDKLLAAMLPQAPPSEDERTPSPARNACRRRSWPGRAKDEGRAARSSKSTRASRSPTARCCRRRTSRR